MNQKPNNYKQNKSSKLNSQNQISTKKHKKNSKKDFKNNKKEKYKGGNLIIDLDMDSVKEKDKELSFSESEIKRKSENTNRQNNLGSNDFFDLRSSSRKNVSDFRTFSRKSNTSKDKKRIIQPEKYTEEYMELENAFNKVNKEKQLLENQLEHINKEKQEIETFVQEISKSQTNLIEENNRFREYGSGFIKKETPRFNDLQNNTPKNNEVTTELLKKQMEIENLSKQNIAITNELNELTEDFKAVRDNAKAIINILGEIEEGGFVEELPARLKIKNRLKLILGMREEENKESMNSRGSRSFIKSRDKINRESGIIGKVKEVRLSSGFKKSNIKEEIN